jgi:hypothetical protein
MAVKIFVIGIETKSNRGELGESKNVFVYNGWTNQEI